MTPALWMTVLTLCCPQISSAALRVASASVRSTLTCFTFRSLGWRSRLTTSSPRASRRCTIARPIPALPPVTIAVMNSGKGVLKYSSDPNQRNSWMEGNAASQFRMSTRFSLMRSRLSCQTNVCQAVAA